MTSAITTHLRHVRRAAAGRPASIGALAVCIIVILVAAPHAQQGAAVSISSAPGISSAVDSPTEIDLLVGRSTLLNVGSAITRVSLTVPDVADAMVTSPTQLLIHGKQPGTISMFVWDRAGAIKTYEVKVRRDLSALSGHLKQLFPNEPIEVRGSGKDVVVSGTVSSTYVREKAADVAAGYVEKKENVVNLLRQQEGVASNQVMLRVRFAEVSRSALQELGATYIANGFKNDWFGRVGTQQFSGPDFDSDRAGGLVFSDFLNIFVFNAKEGLGGVVRALSNKGLFQSLAEPNLIASNGKEASFLAGGEYPYPVATPTSSGVSYTIMFKEFGVRLSFTPTVLGGDLVHLKVKPEVSALDFANAINLDGFRLPALSTRRTETEVELRDGQTFAIAGLMNNTLTNSMSKIPGIGDIPILGLLFRSKAHQKNQTELVVMITPTIIRRGQPGVSEGLPSLVEPYLGAPDKSYPNPDAWVGSPRYPANQPAPRNGSDAAVRTPAPTAPAPASTVRTPPPSWPVRAPLASRPVTAPAAQPNPAGADYIQQAAPAPVAATVQTPVQVVTQPAPIARPAPQAMTREQVKAFEKQKEDERRALAAAERVRLEQQKRDAERQQAEAAAAAVAKAEQDRKDEENRRLAERLEKERARREAEVAKRNAELARKKAEEDARREKTLSDAAERLKAAQAAYEAELEKAKGTNDKAKSTKASLPSSRR
ncbi:MAG TPA: pilus assembly protein N-terminal domain-containing protein [Vicinamibacterales bacterium]|jgi:pilus assembly protein CpaC|nr:pilus assembly protein N-terminal domain-containing protein [Vicinamibacterales bacterium]